ncbi:tumor necrosis factor ligand superfamily member 10-like [Rhinatrema bivittatum]|uniref:tumor necrosis factor ligand superfamily member 10-like n=1 Tax=Rhinatrema bivittatum TaxID=194408 RepID=UPI001127DE00|nr:tumor necrosis factor ligand superfamily member 10-like [Rhinatrema bivittatum]
MAQSGQQYYRSDSADSAACMMGPAGPGKEEEAGGQGKRRKGCRPVWLAMAVMAILALQIACTTGLFVYFTLSISKLKTQTQGTSEELKCLQLINKLEEISDPAVSELEELIINESCFKLVNSIKSYITMVTENVIRRSAVKEARRSIVNTSELHLPGNMSGKASAHLTLRDHGISHHGSSAHGNRGFGELPQSCRHPIQRWERNNVWSHLQNITYHEGRLRVLQDGTYYIYSQIYFRYPNVQERSTYQSTGHQLIQCVHKKTTYLQPILLLKGVGTKCWAPNAEYGLQSVYQGGIFNLRSGDEVFVSVSSLSMVHTDEIASYFGTFRVDV